MRLSRASTSIGPMPTSELAGLGAVRQFERQLAAMYDRRYAVAMPSATTGLLALGLAIGIRGRRFVSTPLTWGGTIAPWLHLGGRCHFGDVDRDTLNLDPVALAGRVPRGTQAILGVDLFGVPCDDRALRAVADDAGAVLIVDGAQSFGARREGRAPGAHAHAIVLSFSSGKALDLGEGGTVLTDDGALYEQLVWWSQHPDRQRVDLPRTDTNEFGINGRMASSIAELGLTRFERALASVENRRQDVNTIAAGLRHVNGVEIPRVGQCEPSWFHFAVRTTGDLQPDALGRLLPFPLRLLPRTPSYRRLGGTPRGRWHVARGEARTRQVADLAELRCA